MELEPNWKNNPPQKVTILQDTYVYRASFGVVEKIKKAGTHFISFQKTD